MTRHASGRELVATLTGTRSAASAPRPTAPAAEQARQDAQRAPATVVRVENLSRQYYLGDQLVTALNNVNLNIEEGVFLAIPARRAAASPRS
jgi:ABC-type glutathione transport system ATPase component